MRSRRRTGQHPRAPRPPLHVYRLSVGRKRKPQGTQGCTEDPRALIRTSLTLLSGHGVERSHLLLHVLAAALGAFHVYFMFFEGENHFEGFVTIVADVVVHGYGGLPLELRSRATVGIVRRWGGGCLGV